MRNNYLFICIISLSLLALVLAECDNSCVCEEGMNSCISCVDENSKVDSTGHACVCNSGWYVSSNDPFHCAHAINNDDNGADISLEQDECQTQIASVMKDIVVNTNCQFSNINNQSYVISDLSLRLTGLNITDVCTQQIATRVLIQLKPDSNFTDLSPDYIAETADGGKTLTFPLIDLYSLTDNITISDGQISQTLHLRIDIGHSNVFDRKHIYDLVVFTNRGQTSVFIVENKQQETSGCNGGQECIVVADLDTMATVCADQTCQAPRDNSTFIIGDDFITKIAFVDPTYTKKLQFVSVYFKDDEGKVINYSNIATNNWMDNALIVSFPLTQPSTQALIQISMLIVNQDAPSSLRRILDEEKKVPTKVTLSASIAANSEVSQTSTSSNSAGRLSLLCGAAVGLLVLLI